MPVLPDLLKYLDAQDSTLKKLSGTGTTGNLVMTQLLDHTGAPDTLMCLYETGGSSPNWVFGSTSPAYETVSVQVISRSTNYATARSRAYTAYRILGGVRNQRLPYSSQSTNCLYLDVNPDQPPFSIGQDQNKRWLISCNFTVHKERSG
jgi:hypothetical protein